MSIYNNLKKIPIYYQIAAVGWGCRFVSSILQIIAIRILLNYLGQELYASFAIITGLQLWFLLVDGGIGSSLQNYISEARVNNSCQAKLNSNVAAMSVIFLVIISLIFICISPLLQRLLFHKINPILSVSEYYILTFAGVVYIATNIFGISYKVMLANQRGHLAYIYQNVGIIFSVISVILVSHINIVKYRLIITLACWLLPQMFISLFCYLKIFSFNHVVRYFDFQIIKLICIRGLKFWVFAIMSTFALSLDYIIMAQTLTAKEVTLYNILSKGFNLVLSIYTMVLTAIWPEVAELFIKKRWVAANQILIKNMFIGMLFVIIATLFFIFVKRYIMLVLAPGSNLELPSFVIYLFGFYAVTRVWVDTYSTALQSQNHLQIFWRYLPIQAGLCFFGMYCFSLYYGLNGILIGLILSFVLTSLWILPCTYFGRKKYYI